MKVFERAIQFWFLGLCLLHLSCGGGEIVINRSPNAGIESAVNGVTASADNALVYFTDQIFPLLIQNRSGYVGGCAGAGCHLEGNATDNSQAGFQINTGSAATSWNWAQVRRNRVLTNTGYAGASSLTLKARKDSDHNSFSTWSSSEKAKIETWTNLSQ